jgi:hypothetical protein
MCVLLYLDMYCKKTIYEYAFMCTHVCACVCACFLVRTTLYGSLIKAATRLLPGLCIPVCACTYICMYKYNNNFVGHLLRRNADIAWFVYVCVCTHTHIYIILL